MDIPYKIEDSSLLKGISSRNTGQCQECREVRGSTFGPGSISLWTRTSELGSGLMGWRTAPRTSGQVQIRTRFSRFENLTVDSLILAVVVASLGLCLVGTVVVEAGAVGVMYKKR